MIWINPETAALAQPGDEGAVPLYVSIHNGVLHAMIRAETHAHFLAAAESVGLIADGQPVVDIAEIGPLVLEVNVEGAPVRVDERHHVNFWLSSRIVERMDWIGWALVWTYFGQEIAVRNAQEDGVVYEGIELIDPDTVASPSNTLLA